MGIRYRAASMGDRRPLAPRCTAFATIAGLCTQWTRASKQEVCLSKMKHAPDLAGVLDALHLAPGGGDHSSLSSVQHGRQLGALQGAWT